MKKEIEELFEVNYTEYSGFLDQIKPECKKWQTFGLDTPNIELCTFSIDGQRHFTTKLFIFDENNELVENKYYVFDMPLNSERRPPKRIRTITLENKEEVQAFFDILQKLGNDKND